MGASDEAPIQQAPSSEERAVAAGASDPSTASPSAAQSSERPDSEWGEGSDWEVLDPAPAHASPRQLSPSSSSPELEHAASEASVPASGSSSSLSASDAQEDSETEEEALLRRGRQLADTLAAAEAVTAPAYDLALALGEGALAAALEGRAEPYPQLEESEAERDAFEAEFQRVLAEMGRPRS
ncbi:hypothetical protein HXX76_005106 [Chlamydomonas incerta]|uniref:Uncharacterized protein n=1 Tax=Chlamydomonas incerta TaxID=51695 RepID=A0A835TH02_CHLIN|nr:hypothetical protein HXX76_005106 [Chlamydomonas incerta]|eukprot:KAG2438555.1 hypothetical protein HXX76_005106 [Chlamydomonas incerta]